MIPDKIFIDEDLIAYHCLTDRHDGDLEYIRKDALLEWAKKMIADDKNRGIKGGFYKLIEKLNSM